MSLSAPTPPLLLTKRLTSFLGSNLSPLIHTALIATLSGKLLAHASSQLVSILRTQCTVAASIWAIHSAPTPREAIPGALQSSASPTLSAVTIQLTDGVFVVRRLQCGLLFVCIGPAPDGGEQLEASHQQSQSAQASQFGGSVQPTPTVGSPSEVASVLSTGAATTASVMTAGSARAAGVVLIRRQAEDLAKWLDEKLGSLGVPEEGAGSEQR